MRSRTSFRGALLGGCAAALIALPVTLDADAFGAQVKTAAARDKGGGDGGGRGNGGGHGRGRGDQGGPGSDRSRGPAADTGQRGAERDRAHGRTLADARERYQDALGRKRSVEHDVNGRKPGRAAPAAVLGPEQTGVLIGLGWEQPATGTFRNHGQRVRTMVALAKELGYPASVGALQGNFSTPFENGLATVVVELEVARAAAALAPLDLSLQAEVARLEAALAAAAAGLPEGASTDWATVDLDVTDDGVVDGADVAAAQAGADAEPRTEPTEPATPTASLDPADVAR